MAKNNDSIRTDKLYFSEKSHNGVVFIDADSFPKLAIKLALTMALRRLKPLVIVADRELKHVYEQSELIQYICIQQGMDAVDQWILKNVCLRDIVLTRDIVFAEKLVNQGIFVINHHGCIFDKDNVVERRSVRDYRLNMSLSGMCDLDLSRNVYGKRELHQFANSFDKILVKSLVVKKNLR